MSRSRPVASLAAPLTAFLSIGAALLVASAHVEARPPESPARQGGDGQGVPSEFPADWFWGTAKQRQRHLALTGRPAPELVVKNWRGAPQKVSDLRGKVVVVDFWATWCGPCVRSLPKNNELLRKHAGQGLVIIGVHDHSRGVERLDDMIKSKGIAYPVAVDDGGKSARAYALAFWPTYAVIDRSGVVRAVGLKPDRVAAVVEKLLAEPAPDDGGADGSGKGGAKGAPKDQSRAQPPAKEGERGDDAEGSDTRVTSPGAVGAGGRAEIPQEWLERTRRSEKAAAALAELPAPPPLPRGAKWLNSEPLSLEDLKGKVVVLDFWATWCGPCIGSIPKNNELHRKYRDQGLVLIGVCQSRGAERMEELVRSKGIEYPVVADVEFATTEAYKVDGFPDYHIIDRAGTLRVIDCRNDMVESAVALLLAEPPPAE